MPSPHRASLQAFVHRSSLMEFLSSHSSPASTIPFRHTAWLLELETALEDTTEETLTAELEEAETDSELSLEEAAAWKEDWAEDREEASDALECSLEEACDVSEETDETAEDAELSLLSEESAELACDTNEDCAELMARDDVDERSEQSRMIFVN